jgi:hypothetical protein
MSVKNVLVFTSHNPQVAREKMQDCEYVPDLVILTCQHEWQYTSVGENPSFEEIIDYANQHNVPVISVTGTPSNTPPLHDCSDPRFHKHTVAHYPVHWIANTVKLFEQKNAQYTQPVDHSDPNNNTWLFITLNNKPWPHRCTIMDKLAEHNLLDRGKYTWDSLQELDGRSPQHAYDWYDWQYWRPEKTLIDDLPAWCSGNSYGWNGELPACYSQCFFQIVGEATTQVVFFTEKVVPPLMTGKPFLVAGAPGFHSALADLGFELYDEIFDYGFDQIPDDKTRVEQMVQNIIQYADLNPVQLADLYKKIQHKAHKNSEHAKFLADHAGDLVLSPLVELFEQNHPDLINTELYGHWKYTSDLQNQKD